MGSSKLVSLWYGSLSTKRILVKMFNIYVSGPQYFSKGTAQSLLWLPYEKLDACCKRVNPCRSCNKDLKCDLFTEVASFRSLRTYEQSFVTVTVYLLTHEQITPSILRAYYSSIRPFLYSLSAKRLALVKGDHFQY